MTLTITEKTYKDKTYKNVNISDLDYGTTMKARVVYDKPREFESTKFPNKDGTPKKVYSYALDILDPALGVVSFIAPDRLHRELSAFNKDDTITITAYEKKTEFSNADGTKRKVSYKGYRVEKVMLSLSAEDTKKIVDTIKELPEKPSVEKIREMLTMFGVTKEEDIKSVLTQVGYTTE